MSKRILSVVLSLLLLLSAVSATGIITHASDEVVITPVTEMPAGNNLLQGMYPTAGVSGQPKLTNWNSTTYPLTNLVDGDLNTAWRSYIDTGYRVFFNLGTVAEIESFLVGSFTEATEYRIDQVKIYVSETAINKWDLFAEEYLAIEATGMTELHNLVSVAGKTFTAACVGFDISGSRAVNAASGQTFYGELGAYGTPTAAYADTQVTAITELPAETNLLSGLTPLLADGRTALGRHNSSDGEATTLVNGVLGDATPWGGWFDSQGRIVFDLGGVYDLNKFLIGSVTCDGHEYVRFADIYVGNDVSKLFTADTLALSSSGHTKGLALSRDNLLASKANKTFTGRYVAFDFRNNHKSAEKTTDDVGGYMRYFMRLAELGVYGTKAVTSGTTYNAENAAAALIPVEDNVLAKAAGAFLRTDKDTYDSSSSLQTSVLVDGIISGTDGQKLCPTTNKEDGISYYYFSYDMGEDYVIDAVNFAGDGSDGANSVAVYVGDKALADVIGTEPNAFYDGGIGTTSRVTNNKTDAVAIRFDFDEPLTGRYVTFRLGVCRNGNYDQVWVSEFGATGTAKGKKAYTVVDEMSDLPEGTSLISGITATKPDGTRLNHVTGTNHANATDGLIQGLNQTAAFKLTQDEQYKTATSGGNTYYSYIAPTAWVEAQGLDSTQTWYIQPENGRWFAGAAATQRLGLYVGDPPAVYDMGSTSRIDSIFIASTAEPAGMANETYYNGEYDASKHPTMNEQDMANALKPVIDKRLLWAGKVYVGNDRDTLISEENLVLSYNLENNLADALRTLWTLEEPAEGRYIAFDFNEAAFQTQTRISELAAYGEVLEAKPTYVVVDSLDDLPEKDSLIAGMTPTHADGSKVNVKEGAKLENMTDGLIQGLNQQNKFVLTDDEQYKTVTYKNVTYYTHVAPAAMVEAQGLDTTKTWYVMPEMVWLATNDKEQRTVLFGSTPTAVYDLGIESTIESLLFASAIELKGAQTNTVLEGDYDATKHPVLNYDEAMKPLVNDKRLLWTAKVYVGNDKATIFDKANLVLEYDLSGSITDAVRTLWTLPEAATGRYVGFDFGAASYGELIRISELAVYGERNIQPLVTGVNQVNAANFPNIPANLLVGSSKLQGNQDKNSAPLAALFDGKIANFNVTADNTTRVSFAGNSGGFITTVGGKQLQNVNGMAQLAFQLGNTSTIDKILVAGSAADGTSYTVGDVKYDNRHVMYYEVYISEAYTGLFNEANRVLAYDNSETPGLAQIHVLEEAVRGAYVGFKVTCGAYSLARLGELGVYGTMDELTPLEFTGFDNEEQMNALVGGQANLLKGEAIEGLPGDYLPSLGTAIFTNAQWLTDGHIDWVEPDVGSTVKKVLYTNYDFASNLIYDLRGTVDFSGLMLSGVGMEESQFRVPKISIYVGDDMDTIYGAANLVGAATGVNTTVGFYIDLSKYDVEGRYIALAIEGDARYKEVRIAELGVYGTYLTTPEKFPTNLVSGKTPVYFKEISARSIDNKTAVDVNGHPGSGNTGAFTGDVKIPWKYDDLALLTDGSASTRAAINSSEPKNAVSSTKCLEYNNNWMVLVYKLDGKTRIDDIVFASSPERNYYVSGVQYYASETYADLFKNQSLLYTTGGEYFVLDEENTVIDPENPENNVICYLPDASTDDNDEQTIEYALTDAQKANLYRYVAVVMTRPHSMYNPSNPTERLPGWSIFRAAEITVHGEVVEPEEPVKDTYTCKTSVGNVTLQIGTLHFDDRAFFDNTLGSVKVTETKLPASVIPNTDDNWLSVDNDTVFTFQLLDKNGNPIPETAADESMGLNGREIELQFPSTADYVQTMAVLEDGVLRRLYNSFTNINNGRKINAGCLVYPTYDEGLPNNRDKAVLSGTKISLVYMKANDYDTVNKLSDRLANDSLMDFVATGGAAGVTAEDTASPLWYVLPALAVALAAVATVIVLMRRKARRVGQ